MPKAIVASCLFLLWAFFEASGGSDFTPSPSIAAPTVVASAEAAEATGADRLIGILGVEGAQAAAADPALMAAPADPFPVQVATLTDEEFDERTGLLAAMSLDLRLEDVRQLSGEMRLVSGDRVNMRSGPGTGYGVIGSFPEGTQAMLLETDGNWGRVVIEGTEGWMSTRLLEG